MTPTADLMHQWAQWYAAEGWPVLPLHVPTSYGAKDGPDRAECSCGKGSCRSQGKHPRTPDGLDAATTDPATVSQWWGRWPGANIGLRTGVCFDVLDMDGMDALDALDAAAPDDAGDTIRGPRALTGRGIHYYIAPTGEGNRASLVVKGSGLDWRGAGGYVVAPPSLHYLGHAYEWVDGYGPEVALPVAPDWLAYLVAERRPWPGTLAARAYATRPELDPATLAAPVPVDHRAGTTPYGAAAVEGIAGQLRGALEGERNNTLNVCAFSLGRLVAGGEVDETEALEVLLAEAGALDLDTTPRSGEGWRTICSGLAGGMRVPKAAPPRTATHKGGRHG